MCYSHLGNVVCNGATSVTQRGFNIDYYKVKSIGQWGKNLVIAMGFVDRSLGAFLCKITKRRNYMKFQLGSCWHWGFRVLEQKNPTFQDCVVFQQIFHIWDGQKITCSRLNIRFNIHNIMEDLRNGYAKYC